MIMASWVLAFIAAASPAGQIAYLSGADSGSLRVHVLDLESRTAVPVGPGQSDGAPAWSPDGAWLAFATKRTDGMGIVLARPDASETRAIAHTAAWNAFPQWSPDGRLLAYESGEGLTQRIVVYDIEGGNETVWGEVRKVSCGRCGCPITNYCMRSTPIPMSKAERRQSIGSVPARPSWPRVSKKRPMD